MLSRRVFGSQKGGFLIRCLEGYYLAGFSGMVTLARSSGGV